MPLYLYAVTDPAAPAPADDRAGVTGAPVTRLAAGDVAVAASPVENAKIRPRRKHLKAHHAVVRALHAEGPVLPMTFGVVAADEDAVRAFLAEHAGPLAGQLDRVRGQAEVTLRGAWTVDDIFAYFVERYDELRQARDATVGAGDASRGAMIALGEQFAELLAAERAAHRRTVEAHVADVCTAVVASDPRTETDVFDLALLLPRDAEPALDDAVEAAAADLPDDLLLRYSDLLPPYSFADVRFG
jgi:hypothetical protein